MTVPLCRRVRWPATCIVTGMTSRISASSGRAAREPAQIDATQGDAGALLAGLVREIDGGHVILFVGSGVSAGLGLPIWEDFIGRLGTDVGFEPNDFLALSSDFRSLAEFYRLEKGSLEALSSRMGAEWTVPDETLAASQAHRLIEIGRAHV